jgi:HSP20 family protein
MPFDQILGHNFQNLTVDNTLRNRKPTNTISAMVLRRLYPFAKPSEFDGFFFAHSPFLSHNELMPLVNDNDFWRRPAYDIQEDDKTYTISVDVPGVKADDIAVQLEDNDNVLHLSGGRKVKKDNEISESKFDHRFSIGDTVDSKHITANLADGILVLTAPKKEPEQPKPHLIKINEGPRTPMLTEERKQE